MIYLLLFVLHDPEKVEDLLDAWEATGVNGVTILRSTGLGRLRGLELRDDFPLIPSLSSLFEHEEYLNRTLFTVVDGDDLVDRLVAAAQDVVGDLSQPNTGLLVVLPVARAYGLKKPLNGETQFGQKR